MTDAFDPNNKEHQKIKAEIEIGDGLPDIRSTKQCLAALKEAGFVVVALEYVGLAQSHIIRPDHRKLRSGTLWPKRGSFMFGTQVVRDLVLHLKRTQLASQLDPFTFQIGD